MLHTRTIMLAKYIRLLALLGGVCAAPAAAQQGSVAGRITDKVTQQPIQGAQVLILGTNLQAVTNQEGRYRIDRISAGAYQVQVRLIGYAFGQQAVTVAAGETLTLDVALTAVAIPLEALVVTATGEDHRASAGEHRRRSPQRARARRGSDHQRGDHGIGLAYPDPRRQQPLADQ